MPSRVQLKVSGRVQGVFYRQSTADQARLLGLTGWVANERDGSVSIDVQGERERIESLIIWCWKGPSSAKVFQVDVEWLEEIDSSRKTFDILR